MTLLQVPIGVSNRINPMFRTPNGKELKRLFGGRDCIYTAKKYAEHFQPTFSVYFEKDRESGNCLVFRARKINAEGSGIEQIIFVKLNIVNFMSGCVIWKFYSSLNHTYQEIEFRNNNNLTPWLTHSIESFNVLKKELFECKERFKEHISRVMTNISADSRSQSIFRYIVGPIVFGYLE